MDINITGNPGTGNTFTEVNIGTVQNYNPNATTVINNNYGDRPKTAPVPDKILSDAKRQQCQAEILDYVGRLHKFVAKEWRNRYEALWRQVLALPEVEASVYEPGKQKNTSFNRNFVANIIYIMSNEKVITEDNATTLTFALEGDKDHAVRAQLGNKPTDDSLVGKLRELIRR